MTFLEALRELKSRPPEINSWNDAWFEAHLIFVYEIFLYSPYSSGFPFFIRAEQHKNFLKLAIITGIDNADILREKVKEGHNRLNVSQWHDFHFHDSFWSSMNMENLDSLK